MPKRANRRSAKEQAAGGGIRAAVAQDVELTVEEAEEAAKKIARAAAAALGAATGTVSAEMKALTRKHSQPSKGRAAAQTAAPKRPRKS